jgi:G3E family GTPase
MADHSSMPAVESRIPVTIITGFLGSGKTTLLNHILSSPHGLRAAVLINEFGAVDIDGSLVVSADRDMMELSNGCICCSMNDGLVKAIERLLQREKPFDVLVIETTGIADPAPVAMTFMRPEFGRRLRVDSILCVVDAEQFAPDRFDDQAVRNQVRFADLILLNKCDRVDPQKLDRVEPRIRSLNSAARIVRTEQARVPLELLLGTGRAEHNLQQFDSEAGGHPGHRHAFCSVAFASDRPIDADRFQAVLESLPEGVFRAKGYLELSGVEPVHIFHLVGRRFTLEEATAAERRTRLVFIGTAFDREQLLAQLRACETGGID